MEQIPDAPWVREAEMYGAPTGEPDFKIVCPHCGAEEPDLFYVAKDDKETLGCSWCLDKEDLDAICPYCGKKTNEVIFDICKSGTGDRVKWYADPIGCPECIDILAAEDWSPKDGEA